MSALAPSRIPPYGVLRIVVAAGLALVLSACASTPTGSDTSPAASTVAPSVSAPTSASAGTSPAEQYCVAEGGEVQSRQPTFGTNGPESSWVSLGDVVPVCRFQAADADSSRIYVDLVTLYSEQPTLAALAYLAKKPLPAAGGANPAAVGCTALGGTTSYGTSSAAGGGLVATDDPDDVVVTACTFADGSFIDEWGIAYYSDGTVRGKDLADVFRFDTKNLPPVFS